MRRASVTYGSLFATLADRIAVRISVDKVKSAIALLFSKEQEVLLAHQLTTMAEVGYGQSRQETMNLATEYASEHGLLSKNHKPISDKWLLNVLHRLPQLKPKKGGP